MLRADKQIMFDVARVRQDFPILSRSVNGKPLVYLDSAATSQKPQQVIDRLRRYYEFENANIHRGVHALSVAATEAYEDARHRVQRFVGAERAEEIVFVRGTTEAINLVSQTYGRTQIHEGDEIIVSTLEHHSNIVPWQMLCEQTGATLREAPINDRGELMLDQYEQLFSSRTRLVAVAHVSNALGTLLPLEEIIRIAHERGARVLVDGAQAVPHGPVDVQQLQADFYAFSGHKMFAPTGIGVLYAKRELLEEMPPYQGGGEMILSVSFKRTHYNKVPHKFEAGTPNIAGTVGLAAAIEYLESVGMTTIRQYEQDLLKYATQRLREVPGLRLIGTAERKAAVLSFVLTDVHPHDVGTILDQDGIAVRTGHHCAQPAIERFGLPATVRASLAFYNTRDDIDALVRSLMKVREIFG